MQFISGDLDRGFTALFEPGRIQPMLNRDWKELFKQSERNYKEVTNAIGHLNTLRSLPEIRGFIESLPSDIVDGLVVEVARELAHYNEHSEMVH